jgi:UPF0755 protein
MKLFLKLFTALVIVSVGFALYLSHSYNEFINTIPDNKNVVKTLDIKQGESAIKIIRDLEKEGVITSARKFFYYARLNKRINAIKFGEYEFTTSMRPFEVLDALVKGDVKKYKITIPEGHNIYQVADLLSYDLKVNKDEFMNKALNKEFVNSLGIDAPTLEGYLFPDTYYFTKGIPLNGIISKMVENYKRNFTDSMKERAKELNMTEHEVVTLASIIEKETSKLDEMPLISAVFHNRLKKKMRLQTDPTVIYGIKDFNGNLTKKDLETKTPYNTYRIYGLPPTPIANPGRAALEAALYPNKTTYLYFVSKNNGSHYFSKDFEEHRKAVYKYQIKQVKAED